MRKLQIVDICPFCNGRKEDNPFAICGFCHNQGKYEETIEVIDFREVRNE